MALGDNLIQAVTLPIDEASQILGQPVTPKIDPATYADNVDRMTAQENLPNFFRNISQRLLEHQQQMTAQEEQIRAQQDAEQQAQEQAAFAENVNGLSQAPAPVVLPVGKEPTAADLVPAPEAHTHPSPTADDLAASGWVNSGSMGQGDTAAQLPVPAPSAVTPQDLAPEGSSLQDLQRAAYNTNPADPESVAAIQERLNATPAPAPNPAPEGHAVSDLLHHAEDVGGGLLDIAKNTVVPVTSLSDVKNRATNALDTAHEALGLLPEAARALPNPEGTGGTYGEAIDKTGGEITIPGTDISIKQSTLLNAGLSIDSFAPLAAAAPALGISGTVMDVLFAGDALYSTKPFFEAWKRGDMSAKDALTGAIKAAGPQLATMGLAHGLGKLKGEGAGAVEEGASEGSAPQSSPQSTVASGPVPPIESRGPIPQIDNLGDVRALQAEARSIVDPEARRRFMEDHGVTATHEQLAIDRGEMVPEGAPSNVVPFRQSPIPEGPVTVYHGSGSPTLEGGLTNDSFVTTDPAAAHKYAEVDARIRQAQGDTTAAPTVHEFEAAPGALKAAPEDATNLGSPYAVADATKLTDRTVRGYQEEPALPPVGGGAAASSIANYATAPTLHAPEIPPEMTGVKKIYRYVVRQLGGEFDPPVLREVKTKAARAYASDMTYASATGRKLSALGEAAPDPVPNPTTMTPRESQAFDLMNHTEKVYAAAMYPDRFAPLDPKLGAAIDAIKQERNWIQSEGEKLGIEYEDPAASKLGTADPEWLPRKVVDSRGAPMPNVSSSLKSRTTGDLWDFVLGGNHIVDDAGLNIGAAMEDTASARMSRRILNDAKALGNFDGKGPAVKYEVPGSPKADGYVEVPGFSSIRGRNPNNGKMDLARQDIVAESLRNTFSKGLPDAQRVLTQPSRFVRAVNFAFGPFHAIYENAALAADNPKLLPKTIGEEVIGTFRPEARKSMIAAETPNIILSQELGAQTNFGGDIRGANRGEISAVQGIPERADVMDRVPVLGKLSAANRDWMFNWVVPWVEHNMGMGRLRDWMVKNPKLIPSDFEAVMKSGDPAAIREMVARNPEFKAAGEKIMAHTNHVTGFTENTLGRAEREVQGGYLSTPTITRAIAANIRDTFSAPGSLRGTMARQYWRNAAALTSAGAIGGTILAFGGDINAAKKAGYLDPTNTQKFILNPQSGANFLSIVTPAGTRYSLIPSPIRSPLKAVFSGVSTAGTTAVEGGSAKEILMSGVGDEVKAGRDFVNNRLSAPGRAARSFLEAENEGKGGVGSLKIAAQEAGAGDVPLPVGGAVGELAKGKMPDRGDIEKAALTTIGGAQYGPTPFTKLDDYLKSVTNPDGSQRFPQGQQTIPTTKNGLNDFLATDPQATKLRDAYESNRLDTGSESSQASLAIQQDRRAKVQSLQGQFNTDHDYTAFRKADTLVRADEAKQAAALAIQSAPSTGDRAVLESWYSTFDAAKDPVTGGLNPDILDSEQAAWKNANPGEYERLIKPTVEAGLTPTETMLRTDRGYITDSGYWDTGKQAWAQIQSADPEDFGKYPDYKSYQQAKQQENLASLQAAGYDPDTAMLLAQTLASKDRVSSIYSRLDSAARLQLEQADPKLVLLLTKWGYTRPSNKAIRVGVGGIADSQSQDESAP